MQPAAAENEPGVDGDPPPGPPGVDPVLAPDQPLIEVHPGGGDGGDDPGGGDGDPEDHRQDIGNSILISPCLMVGNLT